MANRHVAPVSQWTEPRAAGGVRAADPLYYIFNGVEWSPSDTGPAAGYQENVGGDYEISTTTGANAGLALIIDGVAVSR